MTTAVQAPRYVPILKGKAGELGALTDVTESTLEGLTPLIEVVPRSETHDMAEVIRTVGKVVDTLAKVDVAVMLDAGHLDSDGQIVEEGRGPVAQLAHMARSKGVRAQPVVRLDDPAEMWREAAEAVLVDQQGLTLRLRTGDMSIDAIDSIPSRFEAVSLRLENVDLLLDLGAVDGDKLERSASLVALFLRVVEKVADWRSVTVAAGAFPVDLSDFSPYTIGRQHRYDADLWDQVVRLSKRRPDYGDYTIAHPTHSVDGRFAPPPQLRYTVADDWLVLKGSRNDPRGHGQFQEICRAIAAHPEFAGRPLGNADARIADGSPQGPGNGTTWRTVGTAHHLDYVVARLTTLGEP